MFRYLTIENFLSEEECDSILNYSLDNYELKNAMVGGKMEVDKKVRISDVAFIDYDKKFPFLTDRFKKLLISHINVKGHELNFENNLYQFTKYKEGEFYNWHKDTDVSKNIDAKRYCSTVIQLNNQYQDGELQLKVGENNDEDITLKKGIGNLFVFLSSITHRVTPVTNGVRYSLVNWFKIKPINEYKKTLL